MKNGQGWPGFTVLKQQISALWPSFCCFCHRKTTTGIDLCGFCQSQIPGLTVLNPRSTVCLRCGQLWYLETELSSCVLCANNRTPFERIVSPFRFDFPVDYLIRRLKYKNHLPTGRLLGQLLAGEVRKQTPSDQKLPDIVLPVPLSLVRYRHRGFNQSDEIARWCARHLRIPVELSACGRHMDTGSLAGLSKAERALNIRGAFWAESSVVNQRIAVVDDVLTTGATAGEFATELLDMGAAAVELWVVARTPIGQIQN